MVRIESLGPPSNIRCLQPRRPSLLHTMLCPLACVMDEAHEICNIMVFWLVVFSLLVDRHDGSNALYSTSIVWKSPTLHGSVLWIHLYDLVLCPRRSQCPAHFTVRYSSVGLSCLVPRQLLPNGFEWATACYQFRRQEGCDLDVRLGGLEGARFISDYKLCTIGKCMPFLTTIFCYSPTFYREIIPHMSLAII